MSDPDNPEFAARRLAARARLDAIDDAGASDPYRRDWFAAGYETAYVGKWHMDASTDMPRPGFDYWLSFRGQGVYIDPVLNENGRAAKRTGYITDLLTDAAVNWLRQPHTKPFVLVLAHKAPHQPAEPAARHATAMANAEFTEPASFDDTFAGKRRKDVAGKALHLLADHFSYAAFDLGEQFRGRKAVRRNADLVAESFLEPGNADHEEFVQI